MTGVELIAAERQRQVQVEDWTSAHDDQHEAGEMATAAAVYILETILNGPRVTGTWFKQLWCWEDYEFKLSPDPVRNLVKAGALIAAEVDRLQRKDEADNKKLEAYQKKVAIEALKATPVSDPANTRCDWCGLETPKGPTEKTHCDECCPF